MNFLDQIQELFLHARWARDRLVQGIPEKPGKEAEEPFLRDLGDGCGSLRDKLVHILGAEFVWFERIEGRSPTALLDPAEIPSRRELVKRWQDLDRRIDSHFSEWKKSPDAALNHRYTYRTLKGAEFDQTLREILMHIVMHGMYHRGQVSSLLRRIGGQVTPTDLIQFYREETEPSIESPGTPG